MSRDIYSKAKPYENIRCTYARYVPSASRRMPPKWGIRRVVQAAVPGLCLLLTACGGNMDQPKIELNPHPKMHYAVTVTFEGAPGPFDRVQASAQYEVTNRGCVPEQPISGATILPSKRIELSLHRTNEATYETELYVDMIENEAYFSKEICHWSLVAVSAKASRGAMDFVTPLFNADFFGTSGVTRYFSYSSYNDSRTRMLNTGNVDRNAYSDPSKTFSVNVVAKEIRQ